MHEQDTAVLDRPTRGRHRPPASPLRRAASRMSLGATAVLMTIGFGVLAAVTTGLTGASPADLGGLSPRWLSLEEEAGPTSGRAANIGGRQGAERMPASDAAIAEPAAVADEQPGTAPMPDGAPAPADAPAAEPRPERAPMSTVRPGDPCSSEGLAGITAGGKPTVCTRRGDGRNRWRHS
jgi:hypothetical protein